MRAGWSLLNAGLSKLLLNYLCQHLATLLLHQSDHQASSCVQGEQMLDWSICGLFSIAGHQGVHAYSQAPSVIVYVSYHQVVHGEQRWKGSREAVV